MPVKVSYAAREGNRNGLLYGSSAFPVGCVLITVGGLSVGTLAGVMGRLTGVSYKYTHVNTHSSVHLAPTQLMTHKLHSVAVMFEGVLFLTRRVP